MRKPSGTRPQSGWLEPDPTTRGLVAPQIVRPGTSIPAICEQRLNTAMYGAYINTSMGRYMDSLSLSKSCLKEFNKHKTTADNQNDLDSMPALNIGDEDAGSVPNTQRFPISDEIIIANLIK